MVHEPVLVVDGPVLVVTDAGRELAFSFEAMVAYNGGGSPGGVAHAFKALELAGALLGGGAPLPRRELTIATAFGGPGARDGFELVTRAVTDGRYTIDPALARPDLGRARERFVFALGLGDRTVTLVVNEGVVTDEFVELAGLRERTGRQEARLTALKAALAASMMAAPAAELYEVFHNRLN